MALKILGPGPDRDSVMVMLREICSAAQLQIAEDGTVTSGIPYERFCFHVIEGSLPLAHFTGCRCLCELIRSELTVFIRVRDKLERFGGGRTDPEDPDIRTNGNNVDQSICIENQSRYREKRSDTGEWMDVPDWLILAHELCGHALPSVKGTHPEFRPDQPGYDPNWHDGAVICENAVRTEHGLPPRGTEHGLKPP